MDWRSYDYSLQSDTRRSGTIYRPLIPVTIFGFTASATISALVDSGSEATMFDAELANGLGIDISKHPTGVVSGVGGERAAFVAPVRIAIDRFGEAFTCRAVFVQNLPIPGLLGQDDFFRNFDVRFEKRVNKFYLKPAP